MVRSSLEPPRDEPLVHHARADMPREGPKPPLDLAQDESLDRADGVAARISWWWWWWW
ncbi:MAG: hypothetical protein ACRDRG_14780 [Pseudonocardiaceae bacterium]